MFSSDGITWRSTEVVTLFVIYACTWGFARSSSARCGLDIGVIQGAWKQMLGTRWMGGVVMTRGKEDYHGNLRDPVTAVCRQLPSRFVSRQWHHTSSFLLTVFPPYRFSSTVAPCSQPHPLLLTCKYNRPHLYPIGIELWTALDRYNNSRTRPQYLKVLSYTGSKWFGERIG